MGPRAQAEGFVMDLVARVAARYKVSLAGPAAELTHRIERLLNDYTPQHCNAMAKWFMETFTFAARHTPKGQQRTKQELERLHRIIKLGAESGLTLADNGIPFAKLSLENAWREFQPYLEDAAKFFTVEGGRKAITREIKKDGHTFLNIVGANDKALNEMISVVEDCFATLKGWRRKALGGGVTVVFADGKSFGGTASGKYKENEDALYIRATAGGRVSQTGAGKYGSLSYIIVHELGHRYERKHRQSTDFDRPEWWTSRYSSKEGEAFAELFAISNFNMSPGQTGGSWADDRVEKFDALMGG